MKSSLRDRLERLGPVQDVCQALSGSPVDLKIRASSSNINIPSAVVSLARGGVPMIRAKRAMNVVVERRETVLHVPKVEDVAALSSELAKCGVAATRISSDKPDVSKIRASLAMTQDEFALTFNIDVAALRNWEQNRCEPDRTAQSYLRVIAFDPGTASKAQEEFAREYPAREVAPMMASRTDVLIVSEQGPAEYRAHLLRPIFENRIQDAQGRLLGDLWGGMRTLSIAKRVKHSAGTNLWMTAAREYVQHPGPIRGMHFEKIARKDVRANALRSN